MCPRERNERYITIIYVHDLSPIISDMLCPFTVFLPPHRHLGLNSFLVLETYNSPSHYILGPLEICLLVKYL
jgi:hypothetical protein